MKLKRLFVPILLVFAMPFTTAQVGNTTRNYIAVSAAESIFVHANAATFITGESLYFNVYCLNPYDKTTSAISKIAYAELVGSDKKSIVKHKLNLENGVAQGDFFIPTTLKSGNYKLIAYTHWMLNRAATDFFEMDIMIINPFQSLENNAVSNSTNSVKQPNDPILSDRILISADKKKYATREKVRLTIKSITAQNKGNYSVSVRKTDDLIVKRQPSAQSYSILSKESPTAKMTYLPELRGELISGAILSKKGNKEVSNKIVALSIPGKSFAFKLASTDRFGKFIFQLDKNPVSATAIVQIFEENRNDYSLQIDQELSADLSHLKFDENLPLVPQNKETIEQRSIANQIQNAYYERKKDSIDTVAISPSFFQSLEKRYVLDDYTRFPTLRETITEVIVEMYSVKNGGKYSIHIRNTESYTEIYGQPLILIDGLLLQDTSVLYDFNMENIYAVDVINQPYVYGSKTFSGVANFITKNNDYENKASGDFIKKIEILRPLIRKKYYSPNHASSTENRIPDYRQQLFWLSQFQIENDENELSFFTSDLIGEFEIVLEGFTETGIPISVREYFEVE